MMVLHITTVDRGGAYKATERMKRAMDLYGIENNILVRNRVYPESDVSVFCNNSLKRFVSKMKNALNMLFANGQIARDLLGSHIVKNRLVQEADIIFVHWINSFLSYQSLEEIMNLHKPIVFVMHDMWLFTGGCHCNILKEQYCENYTEGCGRCPQIALKKRDISIVNCKTKKKLFENQNITIIGPSKWIVDCAKRSSVLSGKDIRYISNCYDDSIFYPQQQREELRKKWSINTKKTILLFGTSYASGENENKGIHYLLEAIKYLPKEEYYLLIFGESQDELFDSVRLECRKVGFISDENSMRELYNIADIFISPSKQESFGFTICEAMACGTPCVAFPVGGVIEQISHKKNGYLAELFDARDISQGIVFCRDNIKKMGEQAALSAKKFSIYNVGKKYCELVNELL